MKAVRRMSKKRTRTPNGSPATDDRLLVPSAYHGIEYTNSMILCVYLSGEA